MFNFPSLYQIALVLPAIIIGLTFHEFAHGWMARRLGDRTAEAEGRLTINPLAHIDPIGLVMLLIFRFGWAKPVPINPYYFRGDRRRGVLLVSLAGPLMNLVLAYLSAIALRIFYSGNSLFVNFLQELLWINIALAVFNLIPIPPLDGSKILASLLPKRYEYFFKQLESYGTILLLLLLMTGILGRILIPGVYSVLAVIAFLAGL